MTNQLENDAHLPPDNHPGWQRLEAAIDNQPSPTPWRVDEDNFIAIENGECVDLDDSINRAFIVACVNSHAALLDACKALLACHPNELVPGKVFDAARAALAAGDETAGGEER